MRRLLGASLFLAVLLTSCDDGDLVYEDLNFEEAQVERCSSSNDDILYKLNADQAFLINLPDLDAALPLSPTPENEPETIAISNTNRVVYRHYNGTASDDNICASIQPATPIVDNEWTATNGLIVINTVAVVSENTADGFDGGQKITALQHGISFQNVTFQTPSGTQSYDSYPFGTYTQTYTGPTLPAAGSELEFCGTDQIFFRGSTFLFNFELSDTLLDPTVLNQEKSEFISDANVVSFRTYPVGSNLDQIDISTGSGCETLNDYQASQVWDAVDGSDVNGIVAVTTVPEVSGYVRHSIHLKNVTLSYLGFSFLVATDLYVGDVVMPIN